MTGAAIIGVVGGGTVLAMWALIMTLRAWKIDVERIAYKTAAEGLAIKVVEEEAAREAAEETLSELTNQPIGAATHAAFADYLRRRRARLQTKPEGGDSTGSGEDMRPDVGDAGVSGTSGGRAGLGLRPEPGLLEQILRGARSRVGKNDADVA